MFIKYYINRTDGRYFVTDWHIEIFECKGVECNADKRLKNAIRMLYALKKTEINKA